MVDLGLREPGRLTLLGAALHAPPYYWTDADGIRHGFEAEVAASVAGELGLALAWVDAEWADFYPLLLRGGVDGIWSSQAVTEERRAMVDFTRPYGVFDEGVMVRASSGVREPADLHGRRVAAIAGSTNLATVHGIPGAVAVEFAGDSADVFGDMIAAVRSGEVDAFVDDEPVLRDLDRAEADLALAFTVPTRNAYAVAVRRESTALREALDGAIGAVLASGQLERAWRRWLPDVAWPRL